jgi:hypothetical protein
MKSRREGAVRRHDRPEPFLPLSPPAPGTFAGPPVRMTNSRSDTRLRAYKPPVHPTPGLRRERALGMRAKAGDEGAEGEGGRLGRALMRARAGVHPP